MTAFLADSQSLIDDFVVDLHQNVGLSVDSNLISHDCWPAPHVAKDLPANSGAVYVFSLSSRSSAPAGPGRVLKVGKAGPNSNPRFRYQHYSSGSAKSTLSGAIENNPLLWTYIAYPGHGNDVGAWIREFTDRNNYYFEDKDLIGYFEVYAKARLGPVFEGSLSSTGRL